MTVCLPFGRLLSTRVAPRHLPNVTRSGTSSAFTRVSSRFNPSTSSKSDSLASQDEVISHPGVRSYATPAAAKKPGRPKAHTGRATAKRTTAGSGKKKPGRPKKTPSKRAVAKKPKAKKKVVVKPKRPVKRPLSKSAQLKQATVKTKELKERALLNPPKRLPATAWALVFAEGRPKGSGPAEAVNQTRQAATRFRNLAPEEREQYNHTANANKEKNEVAYKKWLSGLKPEEIYQANLARKQLAIIDKNKNPKRKVRSSKFAPIKDERTPKRPVTAFAFFVKDRHSSGDFNGMAVIEAMKLVGREWKGSTASQKKQYEDQAKADKARYVEEYRTVYGREPELTRKDKKTAAAA